MGCGASSNATTTASKISKSIREQPTAEEGDKAESNTGMLLRFIAFFLMMEQLVDTLIHSQIFKMRHPIHTRYIFISMTLAALNLAVTRGVVRKALPSSGG